MLKIAGNKKCFQTEKVFTEYQILPMPSINILETAYFIRQTSRNFKIDFYDYS